MPDVFPPVPLTTKLAYGLGAAAYGIKDNGFSVFLLIFYNQVIGLPAGQVGAAILLALVIDAFVDPVVGVLSDRTHTRWGRRHPWLYGSALPIALAWLLLWHPPQGSPQTMLAWLLVTAVLARAAISTNEVPSYAMAAAITRDYDERTVVLRYRYVAGWIGGLVMLVLAYSFFLAPPLGAQTGPMARNGYGWFALAGAILMAVTVVVSALGTHRRMAHPPAKRIAAETPREFFANVRRALSNRGFLILIVAGVFAYSNQGMTFAMSNYLLGYVWQFGPNDFAIYAVILFGGVLLAFVCAPIASRAMGKKLAAALFVVLASAIGLLPYVLRLLDLFPLPGSPWMLPGYLACIGIATGFAVGTFMIGGSMMADVVDASEEITGRREEGLFFAGVLFMQKCTSGIGIALSGLVLALSGFPEKAVVGTVPEDVIDRMTLVFSILTISFAILCALIFLIFPFGRAEHDARIARLAAQKG